MFTDFFYALRNRGIDVSLQEWLTLLEAMHLGLIRESIDDLYFIGRSLLIKNEAQFDAFDEVFLSWFDGIETPAEVTSDVLDWLKNPKLPRDLTVEELERLRALVHDFESLREEFEKRLREQTERHDGGSHWIGTGGTSPFGSGGFHPGGIRVGPHGGGRSAAQVAAKRLFQNYRHDLRLDVRGVQIALKKLRRLRRSGLEEELQIDDTVDATCRNAGELELIFAKPRKNEVRLLLLMDSGGSMTPHARMVSTLFSAAHGLRHFKSFHPYYFHNCVYEFVFSDIRLRETEPTADLLHRLDDATHVVCVGDAYMSPYELTEPFGSIDYWHRNETAGLTWLRRIRQRFPRSIWLNPLPPRMWSAPSAALVQSVFPMFPLTVSGIEEAMNSLLTGSAAA